MGKLRDFISEQTIILDGQKKKKMLSLDRQFEEMEAERDALKTENLHLKAQVKPLERAVERLKDQVNNNSAKLGSDGNHLDEPEVNILKFIADATLNDKPSFEQDICTFLKTNIIRTEVYLRRLQSKDYIRESTRLRGHYSLRPRGQEYLVTHGLV